MKLNALDVFFFQMTRYYRPSHDCGFIKRFFKIFIAVVLLVDNDDNRKFLFCRKTFHLKESRCNLSYRWHLCLQKAKTRINSYV